MNCIMEHRQLLETLVVDLLNSPVNPLIQYRDFQIQHICKQIGVNEYGGQRDAIFFKHFASHFISYLNEKNELSAIIQQAQISRNQSKTQELQENKQIALPQKPQQIVSPICLKPKDDMVQIIDDEIVDSNKPKIDLEAFLPKSYLPVPNFIGVNFDINNNQFNKTIDNSKHTSTKTASNKQDTKPKDLKLIPDLIVKKKNEKTPIKNDNHNKTYTFLEPIEHKESQLNRSLQSKTELQNNCKKKKLSPSLDLIKKKDNKPFKPDSQSESLELRTSEDLSLKEDTHSIYYIQILNCYFPLFLKNINKFTVVLKEKRILNYKINKRRNQVKIQKILIKKKNFRKLKKKNIQKMIQNNTLKNRLNRLFLQLKRRKERKKKDLKVINLRKRKKNKKNNNNQKRKINYQKNQKKKNRIKRNKKRKDWKKNAQINLKKKEQKDQKKKDKIELNFQKNKGKKGKNKTEQKRKDKKDQKEVINIDKKKLKNQNQLLKNYCVLIPMKLLKLKKIKNKQQLLIAMIKLPKNQKKNNQNQKNLNVIIAKILMPKLLKSKMEQEYVHNVCQYSNLGIIIYITLVQFIQYCSNLQTIVINKIISLLIVSINPFQKIITKLSYTEYRCSGKENAKTSQTFTIDTSTNCNLEIRCVALNKQGLYDLTFPMSCTMLINGVTIKEIRPLQEKSSLKKRRDTSIYINVKDLIRQNNFSKKFVFSIIEHLADQQYRKDTIGSIYCFGLFLVEPLNVIQTIEKFKSLDIQPKIKADQSKKEIQVAKTIISLYCQFTLELIQIPAKGEFCQHEQCFCLCSFLEMMIKVEHKKWICPICKKVCFHLVIDKYQLFIIERIKQLEISIDQLSLDQNGQLDKDEQINLLQNHFIIIIINSKLVQKREIIYSDNNIIR